MIEQFLLLGLGFFGLWVGADLLILGAKRICECLRIPYLFLGFAFISIGTSLPEISVSIVGGLNRLAGIASSGIVVGNKIGSALSVISLLFGILVLFVPLYFNRKFMVKQGMFLIASALLILGLSADGFLSRTDGIIAIAAYLSYYAFLWYSHPTRVKYKCKVRKFTAIQVVKHTAYVLTGLALVLFNSDLIVKNGIAIADFLGVSASLIGILLIGLGTGLPELSVLIASIRRKAVGISMGDLIGSNICDLLLALGSGTVISGFLVESVNLWFDFPVLLFFSSIILYWFYTKRCISKREGIILITLFIFYAAMKIFVVG